MRIFLDDDDYREFLQILGKVLEDSAIECWNYCVMPNHYHLTLRPARPNLSEAIQRVNGTYGQRWNKRHGRVGHVFQGRFKDQIVDRETYAIALSRYVVLNPVRAGLVERPEAWPWSSYRATAGACAPPSFLSVACTWRLFGKEPDGALRFARYITDSVDDAAAIDRIRSSVRVLAVGSAVTRD